MKKVVVLILILNTIQCFGQKETWVEARGKAGFLVAHRSAMGHLATEHAFATEISYMFRGNGEKNWHDSYKNPFFGVTGFFGSVGNRELMGNYLGAYAFISIPLIKTRHYSFSGRMGTGLGYAFKTWNADENVLSIGVSTHLNALVSLAVENKFEFGNHSINSIIDMTHFSNGAIKVPNLGLNLPYISLGYGYRIRKAEPINRLEYKTFDRKWEFGAISFLSAQEVFPVGGKKYPIYGVNAVARRYFKQTVGAVVSFDFIHKQSVLVFHEDVPKTQAEIIQLGVFAGYLLPMENFHLVVGMGYYVRDKFKPQDKFYHRVGMRYVFDNGINVNLVLKSHWARADYVEYGIGYTFKR
jgi:hypothetical protein